MCGCGFGGPPYGIPIREEEHNLFPEEVKAAWQLFDDWWKKASQEANDRVDKATEDVEHCELDIDELYNLGLVDRKSMPADVKAAMDLILKTPIPGYEGYTCADSCYMVGVRMMMTTKEE